LRHEVEYSAHYPSMSGVSQMRALLTIAAVGLAAAGLGVWLSSVTQPTTKISSVPTPETASQISIWDVHNQAHLEFLPVQQIEDQSVIFTEAKRD
jgi:hypothetical protein